nr:putative ribonuclease H-like domain-containing protein [Tanacetum cinerariifolium]
PSNITASPTHGQSSFKDASQPTNDPDMLELEDITYSDDDNDVGAEAGFNNLGTSITEEPKRVHQALKDPSWIEAMQEELLQFKMQKVWILVDLPYEKRAIGTKWVYRNKKDERGIVIRNKARFVAQGHTQEDGIDYEEVFAPVARIKSIRLFLAYASFMGFLVYQMDVKSAFLYGSIEEEVYVCQPPGFEDPDHPDKVYKVVKALYVLHQAPRACQDKYIAEILRKFGLTEGKSASTPIDTEKPLLKDFDGEDVDVHTYRSMIGSLMYLTSSRPDIMFACKKQTFVATSSTEAEYVAAASGCAQMLWIQNQLLDYGVFNSPMLNLLRVEMVLNSPCSYWVSKNWLVQKQTAFDVITVGSTMRIPLLYRGEYSQWCERFMNYLEEQTDGEAMINSIQNDPLALVAEKTSVSKQKEKVVSLDSEGSGADDFSELKKITTLLAKAFNRRKFYSKPTNNNLRTSSTSQSANKKQEFVKSDDKKEDKKADEKKRDMSKIKCYNCKKEGYFSKDYKKAKVKHYNYYKTKMLLAKKDSDEQVLLFEDQAWMESSSDSDKEINVNMVFMVQIKKVLFELDESSSSAEETIVE